MYGAPHQGYAAGPVAPVAPPTKAASPAMGIASFVIVVVAGVVGAIYGRMVGLDYRTLLLSIRYDPSGMTSSEAAPLQTPTLILLAICLAGLAGWILSIVATIRGSMRPLSILALCLGVLAPFCIGAFFMFAALPTP